MTGRQPILRVKSSVPLLSAILVCLLAGTAAAQPEESDAPPDEGWPAQGLRDIASVFPKSQLVSRGGAKYLGQPVSEVLEAIAREDGGTESQVAFVLDQSFPGNFGRALEIALAENRDKVPAGAYALITYVQDNGVPSARIEVPLTPNVYSVLRAPEHLRWKSSGTMISATWTGLEKATELAWNPGVPSPHVVLLTDDRPRSESRGPLGNAGSVRARVTSWAEARRATLHIIRLYPEPFPQPRYEGQREPSMPVKTIAGMFRNQHYVKATADADLTHAIEDALVRATRDGGPSDLVIVDDQRDGLDGPRGVLARAAPAFQRFCATPGHRLALVRWGNGSTPAVVFGFTADSAKMTRAVSRRPGTARRGKPDALFDALDRARHLAWAPSARKAVVVFSETYLEEGKVAGQTTLDWTGDNDAVITIVGP